MAEKLIEHDLVSHFSTDDADYIAKKLLEGKFFLTALELHTELLERGKAVPRLKDFFSNPNNFEIQYKVDPLFLVRKAPSVLTLDSIDDLGRYSDDGAHETEEKVAVLEFELRKAKETIHELRQSITDMTGDNKKEKTVDTKNNTQANQFEMRALNFLVNEYLLKGEYKLTSITFADEIGDQDLDDWEDVGLNTSQPSDLLNLLRDYNQHVVEPSLMRTKELQDLQNEVDLLSSRCEELNKQIAEQEINYQKPSISQVDVEQRTDNTVCRDTPQLETNVPGTEKGSPETTGVECYFDSSTINFDDNCETLNSTAETPKNIEEVTALSPGSSESEKEISRINESDCKPSLNFASNFAKEVYNLVRGGAVVTPETQKLSKQVSYSTSASPVEVIADCLPNVVPNVLLNKREELIPLILCAARFHQDSKVRDDLLHMLFNLIKRPGQTQRKIIIDGFVEFANNVEMTRIESELLPQCWEQITHKFAERRLLVAETCAMLAPYLPVDLLSSLLFSMLSQMLLDDRNEEVRESVVKSLAVVSSMITNSGKYLQVYSLLECGLGDIVDQVVLNTKNTLLPVIAVWASEINKLQQHLLTQLFSRCKISLQSWQDAFLMDSEMILLSSERKLSHYIDCLICTINIMFVDCLTSSPFKTDMESPLITLPESRLPSVDNILFKVHTLLDERTAILVHKFDVHFDADVDVGVWPEVEWVCKKCLTAAVEMTGVMFYNHAFVNQLILYMRTLCGVFGKPFTNNKVIPFFEKHMRNKGADFLNCEPPVCSPLLTVFLCGVLAAFNGVEQEKRLCTFIKQCLLTISTQNLSLEYLSISINILSKDTCHHNPLLQMFRETLVYPVTEVRVSTVLLLQVLVQHVHQDFLVSQVAPAIFTLVNDRDITVRIASVPVLGGLIEVSTEKNHLDKVSLQMQNLLDDTELQTNTRFLKVISQTIAKMIPSADFKFRDEFLIPRLNSIAQLNKHTEDLADRMDVIEELINAEGATLCCYLSRDTIVNYVMPTLQILEAEVRNVSPETLDSVLLMIKDAEQKCEGEKSSIASSGSISASSKLFGNLSSRFKKKTK